jgi:hypothetical protein
LRPVRMSVAVGKAARRRGLTWIRGFGLWRSRMLRLPGPRTWIGLGLFGYNLQRRMMMVAA